jgi:hypothetical protein
MQQEHAHAFAAFVVRHVGGEIAIACK